MKEKPTRREKLTQIPPDIAAVNDYEKLAKHFISHPHFEYIAGGSANEITLKNNQKAFDDIGLYSRVLQDVSQGSTELTLFGEQYRHPIFLAPVAHQQLAHPDGELASAAAAEAMEAGFIASTLSSTTLEQIANTTRYRKWFQLYFQDTKEFTLSLIKRAEKAGYSALVVTLDVPINGLRNRAQRANFTLPQEVREANLEGKPSPTQRQLKRTQSIIFQGIMKDAPTWQDLEWLQQQTDLPIIIKGILHPADAARVKEMGFAGLVVSNHGGRALDGVPASITALPSIRHRVGAEFPILLDSGVRRGADIFKAIAYGANAVLIGRPQMYALAVAGALGVAHMLRLLREELEVTMALTGCSTLQEINTECTFNQPQ